MKTLLRAKPRTSSVSPIAIILVASAVGCGLLKKKGEEVDAAVDAAVAEVVVDAAPAPAPAPTAANVDDVARFPDEKALENVTATLQRTGNVREIPAVGKIIASLAKGGTVTQISQRGTAFLVVFENPKDQKKLMGWIGQEAFTALPTVDAGAPKPLTCTAPEIALMSDSPFCGRVCAADADCPTGQACKGAANKFAGGKLGAAVTVCTAFAAKPNVVVPIIPGVPSAAASTAPVPVPGTDVAAPVGGRCATGFSLVAKDGKCHKNCVIGQCRKETSFCINCAGANVCSATRDLCK